MNNPGMDLEIWKQLRKKWTDLDARGHKVKVDFHLVSHPTEKNNVLLIDVIQQIDEKIITETVEHNKGEAYPLLGIANLSMEELIQLYKKIMGKAFDQKGKYHNQALTVIMTPTSSTSGEIEGILEIVDAPVQDNVQVNYQHYYVLSALRDKMKAATGDEWKQVRAIYYKTELEFYFTY